MESQAGQREPHGNESKETLLMNEIFRSFEADIESVLEGERAVVARINTAGVDRFKTVIDPLGCDVTHFNKTRSVLWEHGNDPIQRTIPIGQGWAKVRRSERDIIGKVVFDTDTLAETLFQKYKSGSLRGWSIKAGVHEASPPTKEEIRVNPALEECTTIYRKWELIEFSATHAAGNSECLTMMVSRGMITAPEGFVPVEPATEPEAAPEPERPKRTSRYIDTDGARWTLYEPDESIIATFSDPEDAEECLRAMSQSRSFERILMSVHTEQQAKFESQKEDLLAEILLRQWGVV